MGKKENKENKVKHQSDLSQKDLRYYERQKKHLEETKSKTHYAIARIDLLIISISGASIYILFETLKFMKEQCIIASTELLIASGICATTAIASNFISQWTGFFANRAEAEFTEYELLLLTRKLTKDEQCDQANQDRRVRKNNWWTRFLNGISTILMFIGVVLLVIFNLSIF
ncbi:hypothetical protein [Ekhidna sp.]|uniref:hypothetical protein n=1 Tax=Ekhidna sp. TaxID=2608089 RepID=UPI003298CFEC